MLYIPRRHRRKLLLPPGLLALAFLLLLGCEVISNHEKGLNYRISQITFISLHPSLEEIESGFWLSTEQLAGLRQWERFEITGQKTFDWLSWQSAQQRIKALHDAPDSTRGVKIQFHQNAKYKSVIAAFSYLYEIDVRRFVLDIRTTIPTLYIMESPPTPKTISLVCGNSDNIYPESRLSFQEGLSILMQKKSLELADFSSWFIAGLTLIIMTIRKLAVSAFS